MLNNTREKKKIKFILSVLGNRLIPELDCIGWMNYLKLRTKNLQPCIKNEYQVTQTIAYMLGLKYIETLDIKIKNILRSVNISPSWIRKCFANEKYTKIIFQSGNPHANDIYYYDHGDLFSIECKQNIGKTKEYDLLYDEDGKIIEYENVIKDVFSYKSIIEKFNSETSIFKILGHNYKIKPTSDALLSYFKNKKIDILIISRDDCMYCIDPINDFDFITILSDSEIRSCGKNNYKIFTPNYFNKYFDEKLITTSTPRMGDKNKINRYKFKGIFFVRNKEDFKNIQKIRQNKATISTHFTISETINTLKNHYTKKLQNISKD